MERSQIIMTADDFGVDKSINEGIINLVKWRIINSVEVLPNYGEGGKLSIENTLKLIDEAEVLNPDLELGVHLTITSGKPLTKSKGLDAILCNGNFLSFKKVNGNADETAIYEELMAQVNVLKSNPRIWEKVTHLTNHHDGLWFYPRYTKQYVKLSNDLNLPIRNPQVLPAINEKAYYGFRNLIDWNPKKGRESSIIRDAYRLREKGFFEGSELNFLSTTYLDSYHYALWSKLTDRNPYKPEKIIENRRDAIKEVFKRVKENHEARGKGIIVEVLLHVRNGGMNGSKQTIPRFKRKSLGIDSFDKHDLKEYNGIDTTYFDGRAMEYSALAHEHSSGDLARSYSENSLEKGKWSNYVKCKLRAK